MKKAISLALALCLCLSAAVTSAFAAGPRESSQVVQCEDGATVEIITTVYDNARATERYAEKEFIYRNGLGLKLFTYTLGARFSFTGSSSSCSSATGSYVLNSGSWSNDSHSETRSGATAYGDASFSSSNESKDVSITLTCDKNGNIN